MKLTIDFIGPIKESKDGRNYVVLGFANFVSDDGPVMPDARCFFATKAELKKVKVGQVLTVV